MPFIKLQFKPGLNRDQTDYSNEGGWYECDKIRFRSGYPEKLGGWVKSTPTPFIGVCRQMWNYVTSYSDDFLALGTNEKVYIEVGGNYNDITPLRSVDPTLSTPDTDNCINVTDTSTTVVVNLATAHGADSGSYVQISGVVGPVGGIPASELNGNHLITVIDADSFSFEATTAATSAASNAGGTAIIISFELAPGNAITVGGYGWGAGPWGGYIPTSSVDPTPSPSSPTPSAWGLGTNGAPIKLPQRDWWFDNFDNDLVMNVRNGGGYWWERGVVDDPSTALAVKAISLQDYATDQGNDDTYVPTEIMQLLVSQQDKHLIAFGCDFGSVLPDSFDPLLIRWASQDAPSQWDPLPTTSSAGDIRVSRGSKIVRAMPTRQEILVWTDTHLYTLQFLGTTDVFGLQEYADNISVASPRCMASAANITYWMGQDKFYAYTGRVETLPCTLRNEVFNDINFDQSDQIVCGTNEQWNEIWWFYPKADSDYNNAYVVYNHLEQIWYYGTIDRTAWLDTPLRHFPQAANTPVTNGVAGSGYLYSHENGVDDDGLPMDSYIQSSDFDLDEGDNFMLTRRIIPDVSFNGSTNGTSPEVTLTIVPRNFPGSRRKIPGDFGYDPTNSQGVVGTTVIQSAVTSYTDQVFMRARARQMAFEIRSTQLGVQWQLGTPRLDVRQDGSR